MKNKKFFLLAGVFVLVFVLAAVGYRSLSSRYQPEGAQSAITPERPQQSETPEVAEDTEEVEQEPVMAPDFTVLDAEGNEVLLSDFAGKPVVINFWATWCGPCESELPAFDKMYQAYGEDIVFMMVNLTDGSRDTLEGVKEYVEAGGYTFPVYHDTQLMAAAMYGASSIPLTVFILPDGTLAGGYRGAISEETLEQSIQIVLSLSETTEKTTE